jgi:hypothetical protein
MRAELMVMRLFIDHNLPISAADHIGPLLRSISCDPIFRDFKCGRTKLTALVKHEAEKTAVEVAKKCDKVFTVCTDGSNNKKDKFYPLVVSFFNEDKGNSALLSVPTVVEASCTGEIIFNTLDAELRKQNLSWQNCIAFSSDNAPVMKGTNKGVFGYIQRQPLMFLCLGVHAISSILLQTMGGRNCL